MTDVAQTLRDPLRMIKALRAQAPRELSIWGQAINLPQLLGGIVFINQPLGGWVLLSWFLGMIFAGRIYRLRGLSPWISLCHVTWLPLYPFLLIALAKPEPSLYFAWLVYITLTITASLIMDFRAVYGALQGKTPKIYQ